MPSWTGGEIICVSCYLAAEVQRRCRDVVLSMIAYRVRMVPNVVVNDPSCFRAGCGGRVEQVQQRISLVVEALMLACSRIQGFEPI